LDYSESERSIIKKRSSQKEYRYFMSKAPVPSLPLNTPYFNKISPTDGSPKENNKMYSTSPITPTLPSKNGEVYKNSVKISDISEIPDNETNHPVEEDVRIGKVPRSPVKLIKDKLKSFKLSPVDFYKVFELEEETLIKTYSCHLKLAKSSVLVIGTLFLTDNYLCFSNLTAEKLYSKSRHKIVLLLDTIHSLMIRKECYLEVNTTTQKLFRFTCFDEGVHDVREFIWNLIQRNREIKEPSHDVYDDSLVGKIDL